MRRLNLTLNLCTLTGVIAGLWAILLFVLGYQTIGFLLLVFVACFYTAYVLVKKNWYLAGRLLYLTTINISVAAIASFAGRIGGVEFVQAFIIGLPFMLFSWRRERPFIFLFPAITFLLWLALVFTDFNLFFKHHMDFSMSKNVLYPASVISTFILAIFQTSYFLYLNALFEYELRQKKEEALEALKAKAHFLSTMSHEIRTPLNAIVGLSYLLKDSDPQPGQVENINALNYSGKSLLNLINDVLDYSKMEGEKVELESVYTELPLIAKQVAKIHEPLCLRKGIGLQVEIDPELGPVLMDPGRINQVFHNLISNAIKFTEKGGITLKISITEQTEEDYVLKFEIKDTGIGISKDNFDKIFESFSQASTDTNRLYGGSGLGLAIVKKIMTLMGSEVKLESEENRGSNFFFTLKLPRAKGIQNHATEKTEMAPFKGESILLVDDNEINVMVGRQILSNWNLNIEIAKNGEEAVEMVRNNKYRVVLMDIQMPLMNGYEASNIIREFDKEIPIIALSASVFVEVREKIYASGMNGFIYKPFDPLDLYRNVAKWLHE